MAIKLTSGYMRLVDYWIPEPWNRRRMGVCRQVSRILLQIMPQVEWHEFTGDEGESHWIEELVLA